MNKPYDRQILLIAHNLRSCHNVGSLLRTAEGLGIAEVILSGYTPYPMTEPDERLPHLALKLDKQIRKTALDAEKQIKWRHEANISQVFTQLHDAGFVIAAIEQSATSISLPEFQPPNKIALLVGREVEGVEPEVLGICDVILEIPMFGQKESYNVVQAAAMGLYHCRFAI